MGELTPCPHCSELLFTGASQCPHCSGRVDELSARPIPLMLLGLALAGCGDKEDTAADTAEEPAPEPEYGVAATPDDGDARSASEDAPALEAQDEGQSSSTTEKRP